MLEKYMTTPRHIEVQFVADTLGNVVHLFERDCSVQRRHQKIIEEAPSFGVPESVLISMRSDAVKLAKAVGYVGVGTVEFLYEQSKGTGQYYFMEMNTRLQVEHPVTELVTGIDLVEWQLRIAADEALPLSQEDIACHGHAVEARLYGEDPDRGFMPSAGSLHQVQLAVPTQGRVDVGVQKGDVVSVFYDPMMGKVIAWADTRQGALYRLDRALEESYIFGVTTNKNFLRRVLECSVFKKAQHTTAFLDSMLPQLMRSSGVDAMPLHIAALIKVLPLLSGSPQEVCPNLSLAHDMTEVVST